MRSRTPLSRLDTGTDPGTAPHGLHLSVAAGFFSRLRGLMLAPALEDSAGLLLLHCSCIHTCFMLHDIDVLHVDDTGTVVKCVHELAAWRISFGNGAGAHGQTGRLARHVVELRAGTIARLGIAPGSRIDHPAFAGAGQRQPEVKAHLSSPLTTQLPSRAGRHRERGSAMIEFSVVALIMTLMGMATIQYGLLFFAKNQYNHAAFMAARAGSTGNADPDLIKKAYAQALIPLYGGGLNAADLTKSYGKAQQDIATNAVIDMLNPTSESFSDWNDDKLQATKGGGVHRVIPNGGLAMKKAAILPAASGQNIHDANLLKLRITHGYKPQVPVIGTIYTRYLKWLDPGTSAASTAQIARGLIPVVVHVTMHMQSDAIEGSSKSSPGMGNGGTPSDPGTIAQTNGAAPSCASALCTSAFVPGSSGAGNGGGGNSGGSEPGKGGTTGDGSHPGGVCTVP